MMTVASKRIASEAWSLAKARARYHRQSRPTDWFRSQAHRRWERRPI